MKFRAELDPLRPYQPPRMSEEAAAEHRSDGFIKLTSNELAFGPLPEAEMAVTEVLSRGHRYPDRHASALRSAITEANPGTTAEDIMVGNGSSEVLLNLLQLLERPGGVVYPWPSFSLYPSILRILGLQGERVPLNSSHAVDPESLLHAVASDTRAVILCNPNNPTGTYLKLQEVRTLAEALPENVLLILDEAYYEFVPDPAYAGSHTLVLEYPNVVTVRTFSKAHGLAGLRVGYGIASPHVADYVERVRFPFSVNLAAQAAATASMHEKELISKRASFVIEERNRLQQAFSEASLNYIPSQGNFILVQTGPEVFERTGVLVREGESLGYPGWSRITVGSSAENDRVIEALSKPE